MYRGGFNVTYVTYLVWALGGVLCCQDQRTGGLLCAIAITATYIGVVSVVSQYNCVYYCDTIGHLPTGAAAGCLICLIAAVAACRCCVAAAAGAPPVCVCVCVYVFVCACMYVCVCVCVCV
jgi:hypothetical protein